MCLILFSFRTIPGYRLVLAANRDEFLARPTAPLAYNCNGEHILCGKDLRSGGTWLAVSENGRMGAITNYRDPGRVMPTAPSRGEIILDYLRSEQSALDFLFSLNNRADQYNGFNLLLAEDDRLFYYSNVTCKIEELGPGVYGLSNHLLDSDWPKVVRGKKLLQQCLENGPDLDVESVFTMLNDSTRPDDAALPETGVGLVWERILSPLFIHSEDYGTRSSAIIRVTENGLVCFDERCYAHGREITESGRAGFTLQIGGSGKSA